MRVMVLGSGNQDTEAGVRPSDAAIRAMVEFNGELTAQGVLLDAQGLMPTAAAKRVRFELDQRRVIDGPFAESKELIAGYWIWQVRSIDEAVEWLLRAPFEAGTEVTIRPIFNWKPVTDPPAPLRVMVLVPGSAASEAGEMPSTALIEQMTAYNEALVGAGVMVDGQGLHPTAAAKRVCFEGSRRSVIDGPFAESKELVAGYSIWQVRSIDEALEWAKRAPMLEGSMTLRPIFEMDDFGDALTPDLRAREQAMADALERRES